MWGADIGGLLALLPATIVVGLLLTNRRIGLRRVAMIVMATSATLVVLALADLSRPPSSRTHLGRLAARLGERDGGITTILERKAQANINILTSSVWAWTIPPAVILLVFLLWRPGRHLQMLEARTPGLRAGLIGAAVAAGLGFALNDSGVAVPAVMLAVVLPYVTYLALAGSLEEP
jgi:hypothetical protein